MELIDVRTWGDLKEALAKMTPEELVQDIQATLPGPDGDKCVEGLCVYSIGTVGDFGFEKFRSSHDNRYHADDVVLLLDHNPFAEDGAGAYDLMTMEPVYGKHGKTDPEWQKRKENLLIENSEKLIGD